MPLTAYNASINYNCGNDIALNCNWNYIVMKWSDWLKWFMWVLHILDTLCFITGSQIMIDKQSSVNVDWEKILAFYYQNFVLFSYEVWIQSEKIVWHLLHIYCTWGLTTKMLCHLLWGISNIVTEWNVVGQ